MNTFQRGFWLALAVGVARAFAHQDPLGEVHPEVVVVGRQFQVFYTDNSITPSVTPSDPITFRHIFDERGKLVRKSEVVPSDRIVKLEDQPRITLPEPLTGVSHRFKQSDFIVPQWSRKHQGKPFYLVADAQRYIRKELQWGGTLIDIVQDFIVTESDLIMLATKQRPKPAPSTAHVDLWIFHFDRSSGSMAGQQRLGDPTFIWDFPGTSNLTLTNNFVRVVWNEAARTVGNPTLHLATYDLSGKTLEDRPLPFASHWNTKISIAAIADTLCLAYHGVSPKLAVEFINLRQR